MTSWKYDGLTDAQRLAYLSDEMTSVRENYLPQRRQDWLDEPRAGRRIPLARDVRRGILEAIRIYEGELARKRTLDQAGLVVEALRIAKQRFGVNDSGEVSLCRPRCILVDEAQDLSLNELRLIKALCDPTKPDALFLSSDAAQRIYKRRYSPKMANIDVAGRAVVLKKNYRNTRQILTAARQILVKYNVAELDEDAKSPLIDVDYPTREGSRPDIIRFETFDEEVRWVATELQRMQQSEPLLLGAGALVIGPDWRYREAIEKELASAEIETVTLNEDVIASSAPVKLSTIESAKGHEFSIVFIIGVVEGLLPRMSVDEELLRDAGRFYVGMTRARERLTLTWNRANGNAPSQFLTAIMAECKQLRFERGRLSADE